ncbi:MAG: RusA family crossover junction endodeoxyribonuclease [Anaerolineales bacterium]|nr:RusA family crossover junction endodeoxyribonuclease [Anaerolineales bacterium]
MSKEGERILIYYSGKPLGKPTMTHSDKWRDPPRPPVQRWRDYKASLIATAMEQGFRPQMEIEVIGFVAFFKMPKSWSKKKKEKMNGALHKSKPDLSNILKGIEDALTDKDETIAILAGSSKHWAPGDTLSIMLQVAGEEDA